ncbi:MAG: DUF2207 domain-containing protein [Terrimesophilobacter sp.]
MTRSLTALAILVFGIILGAPVAATAAVVPVSVGTEVQDFTFESYTADYYLSRNSEGHSTLKTVETLVAKFPSFDQNRGIIRAIPNDYDGVPLRTNVQSVVDGNGADVPFDETDSGGFTELALGTDEYVHGRTTYTITYTQQNVVRAFTDTNDDELYWDTNGTGFAQPFGIVSARVHVDPSLTEFLTGNNACYQGAQGSTTTCMITHTPDSTGDQFSATVRNLGPGENLTVVIGFALGTFVQVPAEQQSPGTDPGNGSSGNPFFPGLTEAPWWVNAGSIAIAVLAVLGSAFTIIWRFIAPGASKGKGIIIPQYTAPKDLNLLESADIIGRAWLGVPAQIVSFAVRGKIRILDYPVTSNGAKFTLQLLDQTGVDEEELELLKALFGNGVSAQSLGILEQVGIFGHDVIGAIAADSGALTVGAVREVGVIDDSAARAVDGVKSGVRSRIIQRGFKKKRSSLAGFLVAGGMFLLIFAAVGFVILSSFFLSFSGWGLVSIVLAFFAVFICVGFAFRPAALTEEGAERRDYLRGMRDYLQLAEADRIRMLQSPEGAERVRVEGLDPSKPAEKVKLYEKLLPFAVLWGVEKEWATELTSYYGSTAPDWFVSTSGFDAIMFANVLNTIATTSVARSTPSTSSGSTWSGSGGGSFSGGSIGGGFSGGGGGGGGGGGR